MARKKLKVKRGCTEYNCLFEQNNSNKYSWKMFIAVPKEFEYESIMFLASINSDIPELNFSGTPYPNLDNYV